MHDLAPLTALGSTEPCIVERAGLVLSEVPDLALASVAARRGVESKCTSGLEQLLGAPLPGPGKALLSQPMSAVWMGPDQWMIGAAFSEHEDLADTVKAAVSTSGSVTEQSDAWACFDLAGDGVQSVLELLCNIDLTQLQSGDATRTQIHHMGCFLICGDPDHFARLLGPRSSAESLWHAIHTAMTAVL
ncbi:MAG: sarcosine oxidase subunit gamma [Pseudomonadota bacterium]